MIEKPQKPDHIVKTITTHINDLKYFRDYEIRTLVQDSENLGRHLSEQKLKSNQLRKFLDAINQIKAEVAQDIAQNTENDNQKSSAKINDNQKLSAKIKIKLELLKPKFVYAAARQDKAKALCDIMNISIDKVTSQEITKADFDNLVALLESTVAYHKAAEK